MHWDPDFLDRSPMLAPLREYAPFFCTHRDWPCRAALQALLDERAIETCGGARLRLVDPRAAAGAYEERIFFHGEMACRERDWHDLFNVLAWLAYPRTKAALNAAHCAATQAGAQEAPAVGRVRSRLRDALTLFDENGAIVVSSDAELLADLRAFRWKRLFVERRERVRASMRFFVFGHALFEKALRPYIGLTAHALLIPAGDDAATREAERDELAAARLAAVTDPQALAPLPLLGVPGWWAANEAPAFYEDERYFRPRRSRQRPGSPGSPPP